MTPFDQIRTHLEGLASDASPEGLRLYGAAVVTYLDETMTALELARDELARVNGALVEAGYGYATGAAGVDEVLEHLRFTQAHAASLEPAARRWFEQQKTNAELPLAKPFATFDVVVLLRLATVDGCSANRLDADTMRVAGDQGEQNLTRTDIADSVLRIIKHEESEDDNLWYVDRVVPWEPAFLTGRG